jgi:hypothetical protein
MSAASSAAGWPPGLNASIGAGCIPPAAADPATGSSSHRRPPGGYRMRQSVCRCPKPGRNAGRPQRKCPEVSVAGHRSGLGTGSWSGHAGRTLTTLTWLGAAVACGVAVPDRGRRAAPVACPWWLPQEPAVSGLVVGVREATGHSSGPQIAADPSMTVDTSRPHVPDTRRPDGGHSGSGGRSIRRWLVTTFSTLLKAGPAGGRLRRPSSAGSTSTGSRASLTLATEPSPF